MFNMEKRYRNKIIIIIIIIIITFGVLVSLTLSVWDKWTPQWIPRGLSELNSFCPV